MFGKKYSRVDTKSRKTITLPKDLSEDLKAIGVETLRIHESAEIGAQSQFEQSKIWRVLNYWLGVPAAVTATLAGSVILSGKGEWNLAGVSSTVIGGLLTLVSAALSATLTTVNASRRMTQAQSAGNAYLQLQTDARQLATIDITKLAYDEARHELTSITNSRNELNKTADIPGKRAYKRANSRLNTEKGQDYAVDQDQT